MEVTRVVLYSRRFKQHRVLFATLYDSGLEKVRIFIGCHGMGNSILVDEDDALPALYPNLLGLKLKRINRDRGRRLQGAIY